ncbi:MAG: glucose-6-phosphate isomerase [Gammaproteobacteria bacterium]|nr:glucose-6-phosphate isomerase [Gammaproteobacteria bacterium]MDP2142404.1 glucose-6-phosphate isomerase [Gammaproteobacteria bacterium]MDP2348645.1 glucose-6-phosphate isomerase [Gammaproteobacteria bacterium]
MTSPSRSRSWQKLSTHYQQLHSTPVTIASLFAADPSRFTRFSVTSGEVFLDYSKNLLNDETRSLLLELAEESGLREAIAAMFRGDVINGTEARPALHVALRTPLPSATLKVGDEVQSTLNKMEEFVARVHQGNWTGYTGKSIRTVINIGIGGSDLGPAMVTEALRHLHVPQLSTCFVSNVDPVHMRQTLAHADPQTTLFIIASKTFTTLETLQNAAMARRWYQDNGGDVAQISRHFVAVTANVPKAEAFGIDAANVFPMWDWVGGRYSLWSAIGLPVALAIGMHGFRDLLHGARLMDEHFRDAPFEQNIPVLMGLLAVWYSNFGGASSQAILPYSQSLHLFPAFLQQLEMESLGKSVEVDGSPVQVATGPVVWGSAGTNGQHSFHQLLHQGVHLIPADFIGVLTSVHAADSNQHTHLLANCFSQSQALMQGKSEEEAYQELLKQGRDETSARALAKHKVIAGNKPSNTIMLQTLSAQNLGSLIAIYEHKVYVESVIWHINAFDQWGVELGKQLSEKLYGALTADAACSTFDGSTNGLINHCRK